MAQTKKKSGFMRWLLFLVVLGAILCGTWFVLRNFLLSQIDTLIRDGQAEGYAIENAKPAISGFPVNMALRTHGFMAKAPTTYVPSPVRNWVVNSSDLNAQALAIYPFIWSVKHKGPLGLEFDGPDGGYYAFDIPDVHLNGKVTSRPVGGISRIQYDFEPLIISARPGSMPIPIKAIGDLSGHVHNKGKISTLTVHAADVKFDQGVGLDIFNLLGPELSSFDCVVTLENGVEATAEHFKTRDCQLNWGAADIAMDTDLDLTQVYPQGTITPAC